jgi:predicted NAD-dependent protein-ADP-ribosyltransferase YbiA (DUF1768 family)
MSANEIRDRASLVDYLDRGNKVEYLLAKNPRRWAGLNLLGFALMEVRERLMNA